MLRSCILVYFAPRSPCGLIYQHIVLSSLKLLTPKADRPPQVYDISKVLHYDNFFVDVSPTRGFRFLWCTNLIRSRRFKPATNSL